MQPITFIVKSGPIEHIADSHKLGKIVRHRPGKKLAKERAVLVQDYGLPDRLKRAEPGRGAKYPEQQQDKGSLRSSTSDGQHNSPQP
jgi:hypothetical protein